ncbi:MAG: tRNA(adenine34) deaminase [Icmadophila ericetorum]|nr:tRNA(adenine34) deaminase [Icmadophila ericetorum]
MAEIMQTHPLEIFRETDLPNVDPPFPAHGGFFRDEAVMLLRRFYVQENENGTAFSPNGIQETQHLTVPSSGA